MVVGAILWVSVLKSGVHATLAGVIIGFCIPLKGGERPLHDFEHILAPWSSFVILLPLHLPMQVLFLTVLM